MKMVPITFDICSCSDTIWRPSRDIKDAQRRKKIKENTKKVDIADDSNNTIHHP